MRTFFPSMIMDYSMVMLFFIIHISSRIVMMNSMIGRLVWFEEGYHTSVRYIILYSTLCYSTPARCGSN